MRTDERWKRLKDFVQKDMRHCENEREQGRLLGRDTAGWDMARGTGMVILSEMARLEKEER